MASRPPSARSRAKRTYSWAKPWLPCRRRTVGNGPAPDGCATAANMTPISGTATFTHRTASVSVRGGAPATDTIGDVPWLTCVVGVMVFLVCEPNYRVCGSVFRDTNIGEDRLQGWTTNVHRAVARLFFTQSKRDRHSRTGKKHGLKIRQV